jgi:16S rRNA (cytosine967-C5)-methyltransferase
VAVGTGPRETALDILRAVRTGQPFNRALDTTMTSLAEADRRLAHEIAAGVLRERTGLDRRIRTALAKPKKRLPDDVRDVLRIGVYQLSHLDRVPSYAAVQSTVDLAKTACGRKFAPLVNAVLRRVSETPEEAPPGASGAPAELADRYSHPEWLVERWLEHHGPERTERLLRHNNARPPLVIQPTRWSVEALATALTAAGIDHAPDASGHGLSIAAAARVEALPGYAEGGFIVQDSTQRRLLDFVAVPAGARVWDACSAPGGKAVVLARCGTVLATDRSRRRIERMRENLTRTASYVWKAAADARHAPVLAETMDLVLVDAPCSATGTMARHPDARWRLSPSRIDDLIRRQGEILEGVAPAVRRGGLLAYLTCSLEPEENNLQVDRFLEGHPDFQREGDDLFVWPSESGGDGGFAARMRRAV